MILFAHPCHVEWPLTMEGALGCHQQGRSYSLSEAKAGSPGPLQQEGGESPFLQGPPQGCQAHTPRAGSKGQSPQKW